MIPNDVRWMELLQCLSESLFERQNFERVTVSMFGINHGIIRYLGVGM